MCSSVKEQAREKAKCSGYCRIIQTTADEGLDGRQWTDAGDTAKGQSPGQPTGCGDATRHPESEQPVTRPFVESLYKSGYNSHFQYSTQITVSLFSLSVKRTTLGVGEVHICVMYCN